MSSSDIRLRLVIRRHGLPEVKLVWPCTGSDDLTIARLLSSVNEVVPLESAQWGLEDYAVELADQHGGSFECLHFQQVNKILKHDDQVLIRALLTDDLRRRRISGRDQISSDGKHLFDGVAFGRPWLRAPRGRPPLNIMPRKRARIQNETTDEDESADDDLNQTQQLALHDARPLEGLDQNSVGIRATFDDEDSHQWTYSDGDGFELGNKSEDGMELDPRREDRQDSSGIVDIGREDRGTIQRHRAKGLELLKRDNALGEDEDDTIGALLEPDEEAPALSGIATVPNDELISLREAFPLTPLTSIQEEYKRQEGDMRRTHQALSMYNDPLRSFDEMMEDALCGGNASRSTLHHDLQNARSAQSARPLIQVVESEVNDTSMARPVPTANSSSNHVHDVPMDGSRSSDTSSSGMSSDENSSGSSDDGSTSDEAHDGAHGASTAGLGDKKNVPESSDSSDSDSDSDSDSSSSSRGPEGNRRIATKTKTPAAERLPQASPNSKTGLDPRILQSDSDSSSTSDSDSSSDSEAERQPSAGLLSGGGRKVQISDTGLLSNHSLPAQNTRAGTGQRKLLPASSDESQKDTAPGHGLSRTQKRNKRRRLAKSFEKGQNHMQEAQKESRSAVDPEVDVTGDVDLENRKAALLASIIQSAPNARKAPSPEPDQNQEGVQTDRVAKDTGSRPRMRVDMGAGRRMLFGALGMKNPKTKEDEQKIRDGLLKDVKPLKNHRLDSKTSRIESDDSSSSSDATSEDEAEDEDAWKGKISYRAVECCQEGIVLSEPPFPFVQRWDPQQQYEVRKKRKRRSQAVFDEEYIGDESTFNETYEATPASAPKKARTGKDGQVQQEEARTEEVTILNYDEPQPEHDGQTLDLDDLPTLPNDLETLPVLRPEDVRHGMVITWKEWSLSKGGAWTPQLISITALVVSISSERCFSVVLALRDRKQDERTYDPDTGERIYSKFEMPGVDEEEDLDDDGRRDISLDDMIEPRIVQREPSPETMRQMISASGDAADAKDGSHTEMDIEPDSLNSIPSGQQPLIVGSNPFNQLFTISTSAGGSASGVVSEFTSLEQSGNDPPPRQGQVAEPIVGAEKLISIVEEDGQRDEVGATLDSKDIPGISSGSTEGLRTGVDTNNEPAETTATGAIARTDSQHSVASGRQVVSPQHVMNPDDQEDSLIPETLPQSYVTPNVHSKGSDSRGDSSPLPGLDEIFYTARVTKVIDHATKESPQVSEKSHKFHSDPGYQEEMQKLDAGNDSDTLGTKKSTRDLFMNATQPADTKTALKSRRMSAKRKPTPFMPPAGIQVINLTESAPESPSGKVSSAASSVDAVSDAEHLPSSAQGAKKRKRSEGAQAVKTRGLEFSSSPSANTRQRKNSASSTAKRGRGRPRKASVKND